MANEEVRINLTSSADTSGVDKMGKAVGGIAGDSAKAAAGLGDSAKASKDLSAELGKTVEAGSATVGLFQNIATASQGGAAGIAAAARAGLGFGQVMKNLLAGAGPLGLALAALGSVAGVMVAALSKPKESVDKVALAFKQAKESAEKFDAAKFDGIKQSLADLRTDIADTVKAYDAIAEANERIAKAADDAAKAELGKRKAAGLITDEQASAGERMIEARASSRGISKDQDRLAFEAATVNAALSKAQSIASQPEVEMDYYRSESERIRARQLAARSAEAESRSAYSGLLGLPADRSEQEWKAAKDRFDTAEAAAKTAVAASDADFAKGTGRNAEESYADFVADSLKKSEAVWQTANSGVLELSKRSRELAEKMALETKTREEIARINAESKRTLGQIKGMTPEQEAKERARLAGLTRDQLANQLAGQTEFASPKLLAERLAEINAANPKLKPLGYSPAAPAQPGPLGAPGTITMPDGTIVPVNRAQPGAGGGTITGPGGISRTFAPGGVQGQGRGAYREGDQAADAIKGATAAIKGSDTGDATAKAAAELKAAEEQRAAAVQASTEQTVGAMRDLVSLNQSVTSTLAPIPGEIASMRSEIQSLAAQVRAIRNAKATPRTTG